MMNSAPLSVLKESGLYLIHGSYTPPDLLPPFTRGELKGESIVNC
jgi:hypothetical protein